MMRETAGDAQKEQVQEDFEKVALVPILREAFELVQKIENRVLEAEKAIRKLDKNKKKLQTDMEEVKKGDFGDEHSDQTLLYKTIMCPL